jgi:hypothetical protein
VQQVKPVSMIAVALWLAGCGPAAPPAAVPDPAVQHWAALASLPDWSGVWEIDWRNSRGSPPNPAMMLLPEYQKQVDEFRKGQARGENLQGEAANCVPPGVPGIMTQPYPIEFLYQPDKIVMLTEAYMQVRHIWTDGRPHPEDPDLTFNGHSTGRWDGETLVVETVALNPNTLLDARLAPGVRHSDQLRITERIKRVDKDWLEIQTTLEDPVVLAEPYTSTTSFRHLDDEIREYVCLENNRDGADEKGRPSLNLE